MQSSQARVALVTGVSRRAGIGAAICRELASSGCDIFFAYWRPYDLQTHSGDSQKDPTIIAAELNRLGVRVKSMEIDLSEPGSSETLFKTAEDQLGSPNILVNNACHDFEVPFVDLTPEILDKHYAVNVRAVTMLCKEFVKRGRPGRIINLTSGQSLGNMGSHKIPYTITKAALEMLAPQLASDLIRLGITINAVDPGPTDTGWMPDELRAQLRNESKRGKINSSDDTARLIVSILGQEQPTTGKVIHGGREDFVQAATQVPNVRKTMEIRESTVEDAEEIAALIDAVARERLFLAGTVGFSAEDTRAFISSIKSARGVQVVVIESGEIIGWCDIMPHPYEGMKHVGRLGMGVRKDFRARGFGRKLLEAALDRAMGSGIERIELEVFASNDRAICLYESFGFELEGRKIAGRRLDGRSEDILLYAKRFI